MGGTYDPTYSLLQIGHIEVNQETVRDALKRSYRTVEYQKLRYIGIDEFSMNKGHEYMTIISDLEEGRIIHAVQGRNKKAVIPVS